MKTPKNIRSPKYLVITAVLAALLNVGIFAQPNSAENTEYSESITKLEKIMNSAEQSLKYAAPEVFPDCNEIYLSSGDEKETLQKLDLYVESMEKGLKYRVPDEAVEEALQNLEQLAKSTTRELKYEAPVEDAQCNITVEEPMIAFRHRSNRPVKVEFHSSSQDEWLINAGYFKSNRIPAWYKVKKIFKTDAEDKQMASEL